MDNVFINLGDMVSIGQDSVSVFDSDSIISTTDALVGPPGPAGPPGEPGKDGRDGISPTVSVGETTTTEPGTDAVVTNVGTSQDLILDFSIPRGATGATGPAGADGVDGSDGYSPTASVVQTASGSTITITDANGTTSADVYNGYSPIASVSKIGDTATITITDENGTTTASVSDGQDGAAGAPGQAATIDVGTTTTGAAGTNASVTNSGTSSAAVFNFTIPRGDTGAAGQDGRDGNDGSAATITVGSTTTGAAGTNASVSNSGTSSAAVLNFTIPRGDTGAAGQNGQDGAAASVSVGTTTTLPAGSSATVTNSGTSSAAVLNFGIPKGDTGATGPAGQGVVDYSTNEVNTGVKWIDGKTIYCTVVQKTPNSFAAGENSWNHNISNISAIVKYDFTFNLGWNTTNWGDSAYISNAGLFTRVSTTKVIIDANAASSWRGTVTWIIYYTKSN